MTDFVERKIGDLTVRIDRDRCIATSACIRLAPELLELDDEQVVAFGEEPVEVEAERLREACAVCPVDALILLDASGKQLVPDPEG